MAEEEARMTMVTLSQMPLDELRRVVRATEDVVGANSQSAAILRRELELRGYRMTMTAKELTEMLRDHDPSAEVVACIRGTEIGYYAVESLESGAEPRTAIINVGDCYPRFGTGREDTNANK